MKSKVKLIRAKKALLPSGWTSNVTISIDTDGFISNVTKDLKSSETKITTVSVLLPSVSNLHSHSFQRAMAGLTEIKGNQEKDDFWTWRDLMYKFLKYLSPEDIFSITSLGQMEMLKSGYSSVSEFHYLHNQANGDKYDNITEISNVIIEASSTQSWYKFIRENDLIFGIDKFGESGKAEDLFDYFGLTTEKVVNKIMAKIKL